MIATRVTLPELALIAGTRAAAGVGIGLLLASRLPERRRRAIGWTLLTVGALSTVPLALKVFGRRRASSPVGEGGIEYEPAAEGEVRAGSPGEPAPI